MKKIKLGVFLFFIGFLGILSLLTTNILATIPNEVKNSIQDVPEIILKLSILISPTLFLIIFIIIGLFTYEESRLKLPLIEKLLFKKELNQPFIIHLKYGIIGGVLASGLIMIISFLFEAHVDDIFNRRRQIEEPPLLVKLLYGGITEEVSMRFGVMSLIVYFLIRTFKKKTSILYFFGIILSSILFGLAHFPAVFANNPNPSSYLLTYILVGNIVAGIVFGWLYWKKSFTSSILAHMTFHIAILILTSII